MQETSSRRSFRRTLSIYRPINFMDAGCCRESTLPVSNFCDVASLRLPRCTPGHIGCANTCVRVLSGLPAADQCMCSYKKLPVDMKPGSQILCADGSIVMEVISTDPKAGTVRVKCLNNATLGCVPNTLELSHPSSVAQLTLRSMCSGLEITCSAEDDTAAACLASVSRCQGLSLLGTTCPEEDDITAAMVGFALPVTVSKVWLTGRERM